MDLEYRQYLRDVFNETIYNLIDKDIKPTPNYTLSYLKY